MDQCQSVFEYLWISLSLVSFSEILHEAQDQDSETLSQLDLDLDLDAGFRGMIKGLRPN